MTQPHGKIIGLFVCFGLFAAPVQAQSQIWLTRQLPPLQESERYLPEDLKADRIELSLSQRQVSLVRNEQLLKQYPVAVGRPGWETPKGNFAVKTMVIDPSWRHPFEGYVVPASDPDNPLGDRWIGFWTDGNNWVGFHGTSDSMRSSIGTAASHGCVRMFDEDIQAMFELVAIGTPVVVIP